MNRNDSKKETIMENDGTTYNKVRMRDLVMTPKVINKLRVFG